MMSTVRSTLGVLFSSSAIVDQPRIALRSVTWLGNRSTIGRPFSSMNKSQQQHQNSTGSHAIRAMSAAADSTQRRIPFSDDFFLRQLFDTTSSTYTYLLADLTTNEAILIDPVLEHAKRDAQLLTDLGFRLKYAMNTHMHADHITGTGHLKQLLPAVQSAISARSGARADRHLNDGDTLQFGRHQICALATPGHTNGCMSFINYEQGIAFTGDTLLIRGCGRTDFQEGDSRTLYESVHRRLFTLPDNFRVYPAHDYRGQLETTVGEEKRLNPRLTKDLDAFVDIMANLNLAPPKFIDVAVPANKECGLFDIPK